MTFKIPRITSAKLVKILKRKGFIIVRQSGSHMVLRNDANVRVTVPVHSGSIIHPKILKRIIEDAELTEDDF